MKAKATKITTKEKYLWESLDTALIFQKELEGEVLELTNKVVSTYDVYFEPAKE